MIVGGAGYIGGYLTDLLSFKQQKGEFPTLQYNVLVYDSLVYEDRFLKQVHFKRGDIRDYPRLKKTIEDFKPDCIIWLAALVGDGACQVDTEKTKDINFNTVKWLTENYDGKVVFTSTCSVYGENPELIDERSDVNPLSCYAETKYMAEQEILRKCEDCLVFRLGTLFGMGDYHSRLRLDLVANILTLKAVKNEKLSVFGGEQWRPLLHVRDVSNAIFRGLFSDISGLYNLHYKNFTIRNLAEEILQVGNPSGEIEYQEMPFEDQRNYRVCSDKFRELGWHPFYSLERGIGSLSRVLREGRIVDTTDSVYSNARFIKETEDV